MTDSNALKRRIRLIIASGWIRFVMSVACFIFAFSKIIAWPSWIFWIAAFIFLSLSLADAGTKSNTEKLFEWIQEGEVSIPNLAKRQKRKEEYVNKDIKLLIKIGVFPGAVIINDKIILAGIERVENISKDNGREAFEPIPVQKIDLNIASEQELSGLPGVGVALAKRAIEMRTQINGFTSVQDFCVRLALMPHFALQIENLAFADPIVPKTLPPENKGRVVDI